MVGTIPLSRDRYRGASLGLEMSATDYDDLTLIAALKGAIRSSGLTYTALAEQCGVAQSQISRFMSGRKTITVVTAAKLFDFFGLKVIRPAAGEDEPEKPKRRKK